MADYFSDYSTYMTSKSLPASANEAPWEAPFPTPSHIRSKRSSKATAGSSSREQSNSPPPLPPDAVEYADKSRYNGVDPRRFTPTLHASLVSEILSLRRELDSKNHLVENLETTLHTAKAENESLAEQLARQQKDVRKARQEMQQIEKGTYDAVAELVQERDAAKNTVEDLKAKLETISNKIRTQDEDAVRTQSIWESEKERWDNERRQLERRVHVTENRLRMVVEEMSAQQSLTGAQLLPSDDLLDEGTFKDSGIGHESDTASVQSATPGKHRRNKSSISSFKAKNFRSSTRLSMGTPEPHARPNGYSLADELDIEEEDEYDVDEFEHADNELDYPVPPPPGSHSRQGSHVSDATESKAKRVLGLTGDVTESPRAAFTSKSPYPDVPSKAAGTAPMVEPTTPPSPRMDSVRNSAPTIPRVTYVDTGYQPSPPLSPEPEATPTLKEVAVPEEYTAVVDAGVQTDELPAIKMDVPVIVQPADSAINLLEQPTAEESLLDSSQHTPRISYSTASTQTEPPEMERRKRYSPQRDSLTVPQTVPSIAIHPPTSRPSSPSGYVLPPGTKNAATQANLRWSCKDASVQTAEIRVDTRLRRIPSHLHPSRVTSLLPSPTLPEADPSPRASTSGTATMFTEIPFAPVIPSAPIPEPISPAQSSPEAPRVVTSKSIRNLPLRPVPLGRPVLAPLQRRAVTDADGPLNRSSQYGVTRPLQSSSQLADMETDLSDYDEFGSDVEGKDITGTIPAISRAPQGRFGLSQPPKVVPEDKEISPDRRPGTAESYGAAPAPSVASSRTNSQRMQTRPPAKLNAFSNMRSRSPSFGSMASSTYSTQSALPPHQIPRRTSSRQFPPSKAVSDGAQSPTPNHGAREDGTDHRGPRGSRPQHVRQNSLRKVQSAAAIRHNARGRTSPPKGVRRRRRSPDLTPVQSMMIEPSPSTKFPIPPLPTPLQDQTGFNLVKGSVDLTGAASTVAPSTHGRSSEETQLVDAIAATMVGEWMFKYIRKRKSFAVNEEAFQEDASEAMNRNHGTRHKRWVWLSPYERSIMWDNKQPTSGNALLGKKGRKLVIQSVLDVPDNSPLPRGAELPSAYGRSILILTPQRALKFTTVSAERHELWMTALSFLAESGRLPAQFPPVKTAALPPPVPVQDPESSQRPRSPSFGRATIRDSVRLAKGRRPSFQHSMSQPAESDFGRAEAEPSTNGTADPGADFPAVPRLYVSTTRHQRKRSNTSPRLPTPLNNLRSVSSSAVASSSASVPRRLHPSSSTTGSYGRSSSSYKGSSRQGSMASPVQANFFEAIGTVRMDAFVDPNVRDGVLYVPAPPPSLAPTMRNDVPPRGARHRRRGDSNLSTSTMDKRRAGYVFDENGMDPFKGF